MLKDPLHIVGQVTHVALQWNECLMSRIFSKTWGVTWVHHLGRPLPSRTCPSGAEAINMRYFLQALWHINTLCLNPLAVSAMKRMCWKELFLTSSEWHTIQMVYCAQPIWIYNVIYCHTSSNIQWATENSDYILFTSNFASSWCVWKALNHWVVGAQSLEMGTLGVELSVGSICQRYTNGWDFQFLGKRIQKVRRSNSQCFTYMHSWCLNVSGTIAVLVHHHCES